MFRRTISFVGALLAVGLIACAFGCGTTGTASVSGPIKAGSCPPKVSLPEGFVAREAAIYAGAPQATLGCTVQRNAQAGLSWLRAATGEDRAGQPFPAQLAWIQGALRGAPELSEGVAADVAWYLADRVRQLSGGKLVWDQEAKQPAVVGAKGERLLLPLVVVEQAQSCKSDLGAGLSGVKLSSKAPAAALSCSEAQQLNVLKARLSR